LPDGDSGMWAAGIGRRLGGMPSLYLFHHRPVGSGGTPRPDQTSKRKSGSFHLGGSQGGSAPGLIGFSGTVRILAFAQMHAPVIWCVYFLYFRGICERGLRPLVNEQTAKMYHARMDEGRKRAIRNHGCDPGEPAHAKRGRSVRDSRGQTHTDTPISDAKEFF
jgi:hypothetical protein